LEKSVFANENGVLPSSATTSLEDFGPKQVKHPHANKISEVTGYSQGRETVLHGFRADSLISLWNEYLVMKVHNAIIVTFVHGCFWFVMYAHPMFMLHSLINHLLCANYSAQLHL
jgi:hypothetical protein